MEIPVGRRMRSDGKGIKSGYIDLYTIMFSES